MLELPLFPLNAVLFPHIPLQLYIFEERYKQMVAYCRKTKSRFGVTLIKQGEEALGSLAQPHLIGCTARIVDLETLSEGRFNLTVIGEERFKILSIRRDQPYLVGLVEPSPITIHHESTLIQEQKQLEPWVIRYYRALTKGGDVSPTVKSLVVDPLTFAFMAAAVLQVPVDQKQKLLTIEDASTLYAELNKVYRREVALIGTLMSENEKADPHTFSQN